MIVTLTANPSVDRTVDLASPLVRAHQTATILGDALGLPIESDVRLQERDAGEWTGKTRDEIEAVIGHEIAHVANGDMVTMTLIQGVMNTFVVFLSRVIGYAVDGFLRKGDDRSSGPGIGYYVTTIVLDIVLGIVGAVVGGFIFNEFGQVGITGFNIYSLIVAVIGAVVVLVIYHAVAGRRAL